MKYSPKYFYDNMPKWKRKKDPILSRIFYRPISFLVSSICANLNISANAVSYFSIIIAIIASTLFLSGNFVHALIGAILVNVWLILDCTDGNIARCVRKQPYGEYADSVSSYFLVPLICITTSIYVFFRGGLIFQSNVIWIVLIGSLAGLSDTMMRLVYHKYKEVSKRMIDLGVIEGFDDSRNDHSKVNSFKVRIEADFGIGGILPLIILLTTVFNCLDIMLIYCLLYYGGSFVFTFILFTVKAIKNGKKSFVDPEDKDVL